MEAAFRSMGKLALDRQKHLNPLKKSSASSGQSEKVNKMQLNAKNQKLQDKKKKGGCC